MEASFCSARLHREDGMSQKLKKYAGHIHALSNSSPQMCRAITKHTNPGLVKCLCECTLNILKGKIPVTQKHKLSRHKTDLCTWAQVKTPVKKKMKIFQKGGLAPLVAKVALPDIAIVSSSVICPLLQHKLRQY